MKILRLVGGVVLLVLLGFQFVSVVRADLITVEREGAKQGIIRDSSAWVVAGESGLWTYSEDGGIQRNESLGGSAFDITQTEEYVFVAVERVVGHKVRKEVVLLEGGAADWREVVRVDLGALGVNPGDADDITARIIGLEGDRVLFVRFPSYKELEVSQISMGVPTGTPISDRGSFLAEGLAYNPSTYHLTGRQLYAPRAYPGKIYGVNTSDLEAPATEIAIDNWIHGVQVIDDHALIAGHTKGVQGVVLSSPRDVTPISRALDASILVLDRFFFVLERGKLIVLDDAFGVQVEVEFDLGEGPGSVPGLGVDGPIREVPLRLVGTLGSGSVCAFILHGESVNFINF